MIKRSLTIFIASVIFTVLQAISSYADGPLNTLGIDLMDISGGARPIGMGLAYTGVCDDSNSLFFNPAGIVRTKGFAVTVKDAETFSIGEVYPTGYGFSYGLGISRYAASDVEYDGGTIEVSSSVLVVAVGARLDYLSSLTGLDIFKQVDLGVDAKYLLDQTLKQTGQPDKSAKGFEADAGMIYKPLEWLKVGAVLENFLDSSNDKHSNVGILRWDTGEADVAYSKSRIGVGVKLVGDRRCPIYMENNEIILSSDTSFRGDDPKTLTDFGVEWTYAGTYILRAGTRSDALEGKVVSGVTAGAGLRMGAWGFDVAYSPDHLTQKPAYYFSFLYWPREWMFVKKPEDKRPKVKEERIPEEKPESPELIKLNEKESELLTDEEDVTISGTVLKSGAKVYVNDNEAYVRGDGTFSVAMPVNVGKNVVEIRTEYDGKKTLITKKVLRKARVVTPADVRIDEKVAKEIKPAEEKIAKTEVAVKAKETKVASTEEKIKELEKKPLKKEEKAALEVEKKKVEAQKMAIAEEKVKVAKEKEKLEVEKKKVETEKAQIKQKKAAIEDLATLGVIDITPSKVYETEQPITRGELASWLVKARGLSVPEIKRSPYPDVPADNPYAPEIKAAVDAGYLRLYPDGKFRPNEKITQEEGNAIFKKFAGR